MNNKKILFHNIIRQLFYSFAAVLRLDIRMQPFPIQLHILRITVPLLYLFAAECESHTSI